MKGMNATNKPRDKDRTLQRVSWGRIWEIEQSDEDHTGTHIEEHHAYVFTGHFASGKRKERRRQRLWNEQIGMNDRTRPTLTTVKADLVMND